MIPFLFIILTLSAYADSWTVQESIYSPFIRKMETEWPITGLSKLDDQKEAFKLEAIGTPGNDFYIGAAQMQSIKAPLADVAKLLDQFSGYPQLFDGLKKCEVKDQREEKGAKQFLIFFEQGIPIPFVPNDKSNTVYTVTTKGESRKIYHYQLHDGNNLIASDGMIVLDQITSKKTRYFEIDFFDAHWGLAKAAGKKKIWIDSLKGLAQSDLSLKLRAENPSWSVDQLMDESKDQAKHYPLEDRYKNKVDASEWMKQHGIHL